MSAPFGLGDPKKPITFDEMLAVLRAQAKQFPDKRTGKNLSYSNVEDFVLSAFSVFHFQHPSFLAAQQEMEALHGKNNAKTIFGIHKIPSDNHIRDFLDKADPELLNPVFETIFDRLQGIGAIEVMRSSFNNQLLLALDGLHFFESKKIDCENCSHHKIEEQNISEAVLSGRARWKIENENNNTLKTKGYHLEHSFGHGSKHLANLLAAINMLAFLFHTVLELFSELYQKIRGKLGARRKFFEHIKALTYYICFDGWVPLLVFMAERLELQISAAGIDSG